MTLHERIRAYIGEMRKATSAVVPAVIANDLQDILEAARRGVDSIELNKLVRYDHCENAKSGRPVGLIPCRNGRFVILAEVLPHLTSHGQRDTTACREAFEVFANSRRIDIARSTDRYKSQFTNWNWEIWQVAWDARPKNAADDADELALYEQWFAGEQGKCYQGMWQFAKAAWLARAGIAQAQHVDV